MSLKYPVVTATNNPYHIIRGVCTKAVSGKTGALLQYGQRCRLAFGKRGMWRKRGAGWSTMVYGMTCRRPRARQGGPTCVRDRVGHGEAPRGTACLGSHWELSGTNPTLGEEYASRSLLRGAPRSTRGGSCWTRWGLEVGSGCVGWVACGEGVRRWSPGGKDMLR